MRAKTRRSAPQSLRPFALLAAAVLPLLSAAVAAAQDARPGVFGEVLDVRVVNVEVVVTDKKGSRVPGLVRDDFTIEVDGQPVAIDFFAEVVGGRVEEPRGGPAAPPAAEPGRPLGVSWLLFIDDYFSIERDRDQVLRALRDQLGHLGPADRMAVVAWDGKRLTMLTSWTNQPRELEKALRAAEQRPSFGTQRRNEQHSVISDLAGRQRIEGFPRVAADRGNLDPDERQLVQLLAAQLSRSAGAAAATLRAFAEPPGRKAMLLLSGGWSWRPVDFVVPEPARLITESTPEAEQLYRPLADVANLLGYTIYPVDVPGLSQRLIDTSLSGPLGFGDRLAETRRERDQHFSLDWLARSTGGRSFLNDRRLSVFEETVTDTRSFYWLGFTPQRSGDDTPHSVRVKVDKPDLEVRAREGFLDASRGSEVSMAVESALLFGNPASAAPLQIALGKPEKAGGRIVKVPLRLAVPLGGLTPLPSAEGPTVAFELRVVAQDAQGVVSAMPVVPLRLRVPDGQLQPGDAARYETQLLMRRGPHDLVVALYEPVSGKVFSATARVTP